MSRPFTLAVVFSLAVGPALHAQFPVPRPDVYFEFQVEKPAQPLPGVAAPRYPDSLRVARTSGEVIAQFVVDSAGLPVERSFKVLRSSHADFTASVRDVVPQMRFHPGQIAGRPVHQLVQMPFVFRIDSAAVSAEPPPAGPPGDELRVYQEHEVDVQPVSLRRNPPPHYPEGLRNAGVEGGAVATFVVTSAGTVLPGSLRIVSATDFAFASAVRAAVPGYRFKPAEHQGKQVHARVHMPFEFKLGGTAPFARRP